MKCVICSAALIAAAGVASADTVDVRQLDGSNGRGAGANSSITVYGNTSTIFAGELIHEFTNGTGRLAALNGRTLAVFCVDAEQSTARGTPVTYESEDLANVPTPGAAMGSARADAVRGMIAYKDSLSGTGLASTENQFALAFQLALWEVIYDYDTSVMGGNLDLDAGDFSATRTTGSSWSGAVLDQFNDFLANIGFMPRSGAIALRSDTNQDLVVVIPTPAAAGMGLVGLAGLASRRRR
ncbi:MAG: hypothetical protein AAGG07_06940 [Planctomycetota bacterium]